MIYGIGTDVCDVRRISGVLARQGDRFPARILAEGEMATWRSRSARNETRGHTFLATRFSAKEAFSKAIGLGLRMPMTWRSCEVVNLPSGQPAFRLHGELKAWFDAKGLHAHLSLSDEGDHAASFVVVEHLPGPFCGQVDFSGDKHEQLPRTRGA